MEDQENTTNTQNLAETLAKEMKSPIEIISEPQGNIKRIALPKSWKLIERDDKQYFPRPIRKTAKVTLHDTDSFIDYIPVINTITATKKDSNVTSRFPENNINTIIIKSKKRIVLKSKV